MVKLMLKLYNDLQENTFKELEDNSINAIITDPPYNVLAGHKIEKLFDFNLFIENSYRVLKNGGFLVFFGQEPSISYWNIEAMKLFKYKCEVIWYKKSLSSPIQYPSRVYEKIMFFVKDKGNFNKVKIDWEDEKMELLELNNNKRQLETIKNIKNIIKTSKNIDELKEKIFEKRIGKEITSSNDNIYLFNSKKERNKFDIMQEKNLINIWGTQPHNKQQYRNVANNVEHPTVKPINLMERIINLTTNKDDLVLDCFMGSGSTGIACKRIDRRFIGIECDNDYFKIAKNRINDDFL